MKKIIPIISVVLLFLLVAESVGAYELLGYKRRSLGTMGYQIDSKVDSTCSSSAKSAMSMWENTPVNSTIHFVESSSATWYFSCSNFGNVSWSGLH
ncbi:hypothetical protein [Paenibacillus sp. NPDC093718]|uniref:hypothetical protein n=1 Tax=Paenibacillus sp. NPDC093718 TaxID=3390601 RepID=UPI003D05CDEB